MVETSSRLLIEAGFLSDKGSKELKDKEGKPLEKDDLKEKLDELEQEGKHEDIESYADHHKVEISGDQMLKTPYPTPINTYHLIYESYKKPLEAYYFWSLNHLNDLGFSQVYKITDIFAASEQSAIYGSSAQRLGLAQDKVVNYMVSVGRLVKELFQIVREVRILDERLQYFNMLKEDDKRVVESAEVALKSLFVEQVEGGAKNTNSVYGLARELAFTTLPPLFFSIHPQKIKDVSKKIDEFEGKLNKEVKRVLEKKLLQYLNWRINNEKELNHRRNHTIKYLNQHYQAIKMYLAWVKPYLKHIKRLSQKGKFLDSADIIGSFEGAVMEIEILGTQVVKGGGDYKACLLLNLQYRTSPTMSFQGQDYKQGPIHMGKVDMTWRAYCWTQKQIDAFIKMKSMEDLEAIANIDKSVAEAMEGLGDSLQRYLDEAQGKEAKKKKEKEEKEKEDYENKQLGYNVFEPFKNVYDGFKDVFKPLTPSWEVVREKIKFETSKEWEKAQKKSKKKGTAKGTANALCWVHYKNFKKKHGFATW